MWENAEEGRYRFAGTRLSTAQHLTYKGKDAYVIKNSPHFWSFLPLTSALEKLITWLLSATPTPTRVTGSFMRSSLDFVLWACVTMGYSTWSLHITGPKLHISLRHNGLIEESYAFRQWVQTCMYAFAEWRLLASITTPTAKRGFLLYTYFQQCNSGADFQQYTMKIESPSQQQ